MMILRFTWLPENRIIRRNMAMCVLVGKVPWKSVGSASVVNNPFY
jgi:hypothetical protein